MWRAAVVAICLVAGVILGTARSLSHSQHLHDRSADLSTVIRDAEARVATGQRRARDLQLQIDAAAAQDVSPQVERERQVAARLRPAAQLTSVAGPGVRVSLTDAPRDSDGNYPLDVDPDDLVVHQQDVQAAVNGLWAGGAEAMTIMDQRVLTTSAVRCIGNTLLLQGRTYSPPFVITAIGNPATLRAALDRQPGAVVPAVCAEVPARIRRPGSGRGDLARLRRPDQHGLGAARDPLTGDPSPLGRGRIWLAAGSPLRHW